MKKIYSIVLMAAALLVGTNVNAAVMNWEELSAAIAAAGADETTIVLGADISTSSPIDARGKNLVLDLAGYDITSTAGYIIQIKDGATNDDAQRIGGKLSIINSAKATKPSTISGTGWAAYVQGAANDVADFAVLKIGEGVRLTTTNDYGLLLYNAQGLNSKNKATTINAGYGIVVEVNGYVQAAAHGMWVMGNIQAQSGNIPQVTIGATGALIGGNGPAEEAGLAGMGYCNYVIKGVVSGAVGVYAKAGVYTITDDAQVTATATSHTEISANSNGFTGGVGSAIVSDTKAGYAGGMQITISGNATITTNASDGYAIEEKVSQGDKSKTESLVISGGTINGNLSTTAELKENVKVNGTITGGTFDSDVTEYLSNVTGVITPTQDESGKTVYVVTEQPAGTVWIDDITAAGADSYVRMKSTTQNTVTLNANAQAKYLTMEGLDKIIIPAGLKLTVGEVVMGPDAVIDVQAGGALILNDPDGGIVSNKVENIVLRASANSAAMVLLDPQIKSNKHPMASVELYSPAYKEVNGDVTTYHSLHVGIPYLAPEKKATFPNNTTYMYKWIGGTNPWQNITSSLDLNEAFRGYLLLNDATTAAGINTFYGRIVGVGDAEMNLDINSFNLMGNSYNAPIDAQVLVNTLSAAGADNVEASIWIYRSASDNYIAYSLASYGAPEFTTIAPMQGFILNRAAASATTITLNYKDAVWENPDKTVNPLMAPAKESQNDNVFATVVISAPNTFDQVELCENNSFSDAFDNGYDASKYMNKAFNVYSTQDERNLSIVATNDLIGKTITIEAGEEMLYTMSFKNVNNFNYAILDTKTNAVIDVVEGNIYNFNVMPGEVAANRFQVIGVKNAPTDIETVEAAKAAKGVYTVLGQYICETSELNQLPAGIYVVDGQKIVK